MSEPNVPAQPPEAPQARRNRWRKPALIVSLVTLLIIWQDAIWDAIRQQWREATGQTETVLETQPSNAVEPVPETTGDIPAAQQPLPAEAPVMAEPAVSSEPATEEMPVAEAPPAAPEIETPSLAEAPPAMTGAAMPSEAAEAAAAAPVPAVTEAPAIQPAEDAVSAAADIPSGEWKTLQAELTRLRDKVNRLQDQILELQKPKLNADPRLTLMVGLWQLQQKLQASQPFDTEWQWLLSHWQRANEQTILSLPAPPNPELMNRYAHTGLAAPSQLLAELQDVLEAVGTHYPSQTGLWDRSVNWIKRQFQWQTPAKPELSGTNFHAEDVENYLHRIREELEQRDMREAARLAAELQHYHRQYDTVPPMPLARFLEQLTAAQQLRDQIDGWLRQFLQAGAGS